MSEKTVEFLNIGPCRSEKEIFSDIILYCYEAETVENGQSIIWKLYSKSTIDKPSLKAIELSRTSSNPSSPLIIKFKNPTNLVFAKQKMTFVIVDEDEDGTQIGYWKGGDFSPISKTFSPSRGTFGFFKKGNFTPIPKGGKIVMNGEEYDSEGKYIVNLLQTFNSVDENHAIPPLFKRPKLTKFKKNKSKGKKSKRILKGKKSKSKRKTSLKKKK